MIKEKLICVCMLERSLKNYKKNPDSDLVLEFLKDEGFEPLVRTDRSSRKKSEYEILTLYSKTRNLIPKELALAQWSHKESVLQDYKNVSSRKPEYAYLLEKITIDSSSKTFDALFLRIQQFAYVIKNERDLLLLMRTYVLMSRNYISLQRTEENGMYMVTRKILLRRWMFLIKSRSEKLSSVVHLLLTEDSIKNKKQKHMFWGNEMAPTTKEKMLFFNLQLKNMFDRQLLTLEKSYRSPKTNTEKWHSMIIQYEKMVRKIY